MFRSTWIWRCLPPYGFGHYGALHGRKLRAQEIRRQIIQLLLGKTLSGKRQLKNRDGGRVVGQDERRNCSRRILPDGGLRDAP